MASLPGLLNRFNGQSLKARVLSGSAWILVGYLGNQALRFGSNIVLTRLLFPEAFGLMVLVNTIIAGLEMLSDVGTRAYLVQSKRGEDPEVLATAFSVQAIRGILLWGGAAALSAPAAVFFEKPELAAILPVAAFSMVILGLRSTKVMLASRNLNIGRLTAMNLGAQSLAIATMITWAWFSPSVWALVAGTLVGGTARVIASHLFFPGHRDRFGWNGAAALDMFRFGGWILLSTMLAYLSGQGDVLVMGRLLSAADLGIFGIAVLLARVVGQGVSQLANGILFPAYAKVNRERPEKVRQVLSRARMSLMGAGALAYLPFAAFGSDLVTFIYDPRYHDAGWMLQILACGFATGLIARSYEGVLHAKGMSFQNTLLQAFQVSIKFGCMIAGYLVFGLPGLIAGVAFNSVFSYPVLAVIMARAEVWQPRVDALAWTVAAIGTGLFFWLTPLADLFQITPAP